MPEKFSKWVACWGNATSITDRKEATYAKDLTLRYPIRACFSGSKLRFHFSNLTGTESVQISEAYVAKSVQSSVQPAAQSTNAAYAPTAITFDGLPSATIPAGEEILSDEIPFDIVAGEMFDVSLYFADFTQMNAGTAITGPLSGGKYSYGNFAKSAVLPDDLTRKTNWIYFLNTIDVFTEEKNFALVCFGDSITAQDWPDYLTLRCAREGFNNVAIIRRAVSGTRILREYSCITYAAYGLKGATRFPIESTSSARGVTCLLPMTSSTVFGRFTSRMRARSASKFTAVRFFRFTVGAPTTRTATSSARLSMNGSAPRLISMAVSILIRRFAVMTIPSVSPTTSTRATICIQAPRRTKQWPNAFQKIC